MSVSFTIKVDNTDKTIDEMKQAVNAALEKIGIVAEQYAVYEIENNPRRVDTGRLRNSITYKVEQDRAVHIGSNVEYAKYVHYGTSRMKENPFLYKALAQHMNEYKDIIKTELSN